MPISVETTPIEGLLVVRLAVHTDTRGWFKEAWHREKLIRLGIPDLGPVQQNISFNTRRGTTRGIHAETWDKFVTVAAGRAFAAWVDLREGPRFGTTHVLELDPSVAVFVPRGVGNAYQTLEDATAYSYLVNEHWRPEDEYTAVALDDPDLGLPWPIPIAEAEVAGAALAAPGLGAVQPVPPRKTLIIGRRGQVGRALQAYFPDAVAVDRGALDVTDPGAVAAWPWSEYELVLNAAAYTAADAAETAQGRAASWIANASAPAALARLAGAHRFTLVHYSSDYVFDGRLDEHDEAEPFSPLGVYGQSKAAGDLAVATAPAHYVLRTSWVVGDGHNFVRTMQDLAARGMCPDVVDDQRGRLTFADELARATRHLLDVAAPYGTYNVTNGGPSTSWADIAAEVFRLAGRDPQDVRRVSTAEYAAGKNLAPRPLNSVLRLVKLRQTGFTAEDSFEALRRYCDRGQQQRP